MYTSKLAGDPDSGCTLTPHSAWSSPNASSARFCGRGRHSKSEGHVAELSAQCQPVMKSRPSTAATHTHTR